MEQQYDRLARKAFGLLEGTESQKRVLIGIAGVPGSGKTTLARHVVSRLNKLASRGQQAEGNSDVPLAVDLPMDGFHLTRADLRHLDPAADGLHRRGAAFTFNGDAFRALIQELSLNTSQTVWAPSFNHATKDPIENSIAIRPASRIIIIEGNYCALNRRPWSDAAALMTELWYVDVPSQVTHSRLAKRHLASGIVADEKEAWDRATGTDELNARDIRANLLDVAEVLTLE